MDTLLTICVVGPENYEKNNFEIQFCIKLFLPEAERVGTLDI